MTTFTTATPAGAGIAVPDAFPACLAVTLREEGGYGDDPDDPGGPTNLGITQRTWSDWIGRPATIADIKALSVAKVTPLYRAQFWQALYCDNLPGPLALCVFDFGVNSGISHAARYLQGLVGAVVDGHVGPGTVAAAARFVAANSLNALVRQYQAARGQYDRSLGGYTHDGKGWDARVAAVQGAALKMIGGN